MPVIFEGQYHFPFILVISFASLLIYLPYRSVMREDGWVLTFPDTPLPQIPIMIQLVGIRAPQSYLSLSRYIPTDSHNVNKLGSIGTPTKFKGNLMSVFIFLRK